MILPVDTHLILWSSSKKVNINQAANLEVHIEKKPKDQSVSVGISFL